MSVTSENSNESINSLYDVDQLNVPEIALQNTLSVNDSIGRTESVRSLTDYHLSEEYAKRKVAQILQLLKCLRNQYDGKTNAKLSLTRLIDIIHDKYYMHVSLTFINDYIGTHRPPRDYYLHYYIFFLNYSIYYHKIRRTSDIVDARMSRRHAQYGQCIKNQLNYIRHIINSTRDTRAIW